jgi:hypothetical protein
MAKLRFNRLFHSAVSSTYSSQSRLWSLLTLASVQGMPLQPFLVLPLGWLAPTSSIGPCRFIWLLRAESAAIALTEYTDDPSLTGPWKAYSVCLTPERKGRSSEGTRTKRSIVSSTCYYIDEALFFEAEHSYISTEKREGRVGKKTGTISPFTSLVILSLTWIMLWSLSFAMKRTVAYTKTILIAGALICLVVIRGIPCVGMLWE